MENKKFKVGQVWRRRDWKVEIIDRISESENNNFPVISKTNETFTLAGKFLLNGPDSRMDLVELITDSPESKQLTAEDIENCLPADAHLCGCGWIKISAQGLQDFAKAIISNTLIGFEKT